MKAIKVANGDFYVAGLLGMGKKRVRKGNLYREKFFVDASGTVHVGRIYLPKEFIGKRVRFKIELVEYSEN